MHTQKILSVLEERRNSQLVEEQDIKLDMLLETVKNIKNISLGMQHEISEQNEMLDKIKERIENTDTKVMKATRQTEKIAPELKSSCILI